MHIKFSCYMKIKKLNLTAFLLILTICISCKKQSFVEPQEDEDLQEVTKWDCELDERLVCENGSYFLQANGQLYPLDMKIITVKLKPGEVIGKEYEVLSVSLGFINLSVPEGIDVLDYACMLIKTGKFDLVELNSYGKYA